MLSLEDYKGIVSDEIIAGIHKKTRKIYGNHVVHINSTYQGGGVAEILGSLVPLMNDIGIDAGWRILHGTPDFFDITKKFHNALQGENINFSKMKEKLYIQNNVNFAQYTHLNHDCVVIHDPQPLPLIKFYKRMQPWIWRFHIDASSPNKKLWEFLKTFILRYDVVIVSSEKYIKEDLPVEHRIIPPCIDPISPKNSEVTEKMMNKYLKKFNVPVDKPIITQISRFDKWKDPLGVIEIYKKVREEIDCRLVMCGSMATDDPEGWQIYEKVKKKANKYLETGDIILLTIENNFLVNVLQRASAVIIQKSIREGFGLTVTEALWKGTPVVASNVGGIPLQISNGKNGFLHDPFDLDGFAKTVVKILKDSEMAREIGKNGKEYVREKFLITRLLSDYIELFNEIMI